MTDTNDVAVVSTEATKVGKAHISATINPEVVEPMRKYCKEQKISFSRGLEQAMKKFLETV